jgi:hypothetical protein
MSPPVGRGNYRGPGVRSEVSFPSVTPMKTQRTRIVIGTEPFVLRTAVQRVLATDPRIDCVLVPAEGDPLALATRADVLIVSAPLEVADVVVARLEEASSDIELSRNGETRSLPYSGLMSLGEVLVSIDSIFDPTWDEQRGPPPTTRSDPGEGGGPRDT